MKLLLDCDDVFDRLTRGPFPSGAEDDSAVEAHLRVCHDCREMAEALRPAVDLLHNAYPGEALPEYRGEAAGAAEMIVAPAAKAKSEWSLGWQLVAASLLGVVIGVLAAGGSFTVKKGRSSAAAGQPRASGLAMLASLKLSEVCIPSGMSLASTERLHCCTECHSSGAGAKKGVDVARLQLACVSCHDRSP